MYEILGFKNVDFVAQDQKHVQGIEFYLLDRETYQSIVGNAVLIKFFPTAKIFGSPKVGAACEFSFKVSSKYVSLDSITIHENTSNIPF